ncbi:alpha-hydroxy acid oxidase [Aestuariirhabdus litorea]|uniref:L-lactate dehydrogenase n=1 Tax=Aestuariirhabdus litorea TaxID=2528527 RepID=A0A3P3VNK6_9GAMM|nr:alpha-hydroxy acid oxidase [Aestuariirhabdus litorea]RRJ82413.1 L-lactate dehydrogenase [Aestuariirhabdus litorea]RWW92576.1 L-lactate dehydrogenase [Endozoicomonadaceae bacterium GTF-13]
MEIVNFNPVTVDDYRRRARRRLPRFLFDFIDCGANNEATLARNATDFDGYQLVQRVMKDVSQVDTRTTLAGQPSSMPLALAPIGMAGLFARRGEVQAAMAARSVDIPFTLSAFGISSTEEVALASGRPAWFQLYMLKDRDLMQALLERAQRAGCTTLVFAVDAPLTGFRTRVFRNGVAAGGRVGKISKAAQILSSPHWLLNVAIKGKPLSIGNLADLRPDLNELDACKAFIESQYDPSVTWEEIAWLRSLWPGKLLIKGVLETDDAVAAIDVGADGVVVSNHGGRQLDSVASTISRLPAIAAAVGERAEVYLDGGVRNGLDLLKAVALGARGVLIGRPWVWALAGGGEEGLANLLTRFQHETSIGMALMGINQVGQLSPEVIERVERR